MTEHTAVRAARRRGDVLFAVCVVAGFGVLAWVIITMQSLSRDLTEANDARDQLAHQVQQLGASPVAGPPGTRGAPGPAGAGRPGASGVPGVPGASGAAGRTGASGAPGKDGAEGRPGTAGPSGAPGTDGSPGAVGPSGASGPAGPAGPEGQAGQDGKDGRDGADGAAGQPPAGWAWTAPDGTAYSCTRVAGFDASSPQYTCAPTSPSSPGTPTPTVSQAGLVPRRKD